ncbi:rhomboid family intramembrane serine protease [Sphingomonas sp. CGMCC 1.13654]|uniref:Rhomboid family intramembrane serine protease n=1 Tax=Sphingomonas chungangi TaxID=2683589 RepID=A0A838LC62_9SPHN|nr:rhomboid family intramembrane serine protease [Sphingomonas chungangi]MBA2936219.1 rhomboid family intramembrane serine protease [Sphingomonas chungangi]MVW55604.1 rhomboid family intramembrane serine protease [Sphingomonas chungangi]
MRLPPARATIAIAAVTALAWVAAVLAGQTDRIAMLAGFIPARIGGLQIEGAAPVWLTPLSATLVHAGIWHVGFNLLMIVFCGRLVEASIGPGGVIIAYVVGAYVACAAQYAVAPHSGIPMVGASGAGSALIGAYSLLYSRRRAEGWGPFTGQFLQILWLAIAWIGIQILLDYASADVPGMPEGALIAAPAHVGGFLTGLALARPLLLFRYRDA